VEKGEGIQEEKRWEERKRKRKGKEREEKKGEETTRVEGHRLFIYFGKTCCIYDIIASG